MSEFRYCKLEQTQVIVAPERLSRPINFSNVKKESTQNNCPFDHGHEDQLPKTIHTVYRDEKWACKVVPNLYNALCINTLNESVKEYYFEKHTGFGAHEVVIETPDHHKKIWEYSQEEYFDYLSCLRQRVESLKKDVRLNYISVFKNYGKNAGASQEHPHSQVIASSVIPKKIQDQLEHLKSYYTKHQRALLDDMVQDEINYEQNIIFSNDSFIVYCPYASRFPFMIHIVPLSSIATLSECDDTLLDQLAQTMQSTFQMFYKTLGNIDFNMLFKNVPYKEYDQNTKNYYRFYVQIIPRIYTIAGFELDSDTFINVVPSQVASQQYKEHL